MVLIDANQKEFFFELKQKYTLTFVSIVIYYVEVERGIFETQQIELAELEHPVDKRQEPFEIITVNSLSNSKRLLDLNQSIFDYKKKAKNYFDENRLDKAIKVYREEILPFLLENHARDDEQMATCYRQMALLYYQENEKNARQVLDYYQKAIDIYERQVDDFYTEYALN